MAVCEKCGKILGFSSGSEVKIRGDTYCRSCSKLIPTCDKCKWHYNSDIHPRYGCCHYFNQYLQDYDNICSAYEEGPQVYDDVTL